MRRPLDLSLVDNHPLGLLHAPNRDRCEVSLDQLEVEPQRFTGSDIRWPNQNLVLASDFNGVRFHLQASRERSLGNDLVSNRCETELELSRIDCCKIKLDQHKNVSRVVDHLDVLCDIANRGSFDSAGNNSGTGLGSVIDQRCRDDGSRDCFCRIDDLLDSRNSQSDIHGRNTCEVERLESHLSCRLSDRLRSHSSNGFARFGLGLSVLGEANLNKLKKLSLRHSSLSRVIHVPESFGSGRPELVKQLSLVAEELLEVDNKLLSGH